jgi:hypothetical protein
MATITLANRTPLASGSARDVYAHPDDASLLIKVIRPDAIEKRYGRGRPWYKTTRRYRHFISYLREVREQIALRAQRPGHPGCLQKIAGFADTDLGFGLVVEAARDRQGQLAPALPRLIEEGRFDAVARGHLEACLAELFDLPIILADLHGANLVYAWSETRGHHFVLVDGIGCKNLIPLNRIGAINRYTKRRLIERLMRSVDEMLADALPERRGPYQPLAAE